MGKALYRKYRSRKLSEVVGQEHVTTLLENALKSDRIAHAYLFTGPRGVGKTSIARILAHEINQLPYSEDETHLDIIEIDAASNNGVDDIRDLREKVTLAPTSAQRKIYIIDEVHMLSKPAFNALLKTLEEPPAHVVFILATTDVDKLPDTIISRTQRHTFRRASTENIIKNLKSIAKKESIKIDPAALKLIAHHSDGSYRDSVSLLDQLTNTVSKNETITTSVIEQALGLAPNEAIEQLLSAVKARDFGHTVVQLKALEASGIQATIVASQLIRRIHDVASDSPELLELLDALLEVGQSAAPSAKLLAVLGMYTKPAAKQTHRSTLASVAAPIASEPLPELAKKATEEHPVDDIVIEETIPSPVVEKPVAPKQVAHASPSEALDVKQLLADAKDAGIGIYSLLSQSAITYDSGIITIYARKTFNKKRLESSQNTRTLVELLSIQGLEHATITIEAGSPPSKNSQVAAVAAIMGGGEEVSAEDAL
jgi:DNA polymerase-3 subunit gamma/tau